MPEIVAAKYHNNLYSKTMVTNVQYIQSLQAFAFSTVKRVYIKTLVARAPVFQFHVWSAGATVKPPKEII